MSIDQIKEEIKVMDPVSLQKLSTFLLKFRRSQDPERKQEIADLIDSPDKEWVSLDDFERRVAD